MEWFIYNNTGDPFNPLSYSPVAVPSCLGNSQLCAIRAFRQIINGQPRPTLTPTLQAEITSAIGTLTETSNVLLIT